MSDKYNIDGHKLIYHPGRVAEWAGRSDDWETAKSIYPIYVEVSPFGACNHRCTFCAVDYVGYKNRSLDAGVFRERLTEMARLGIKSIMYAGEGEPTLWKPLPEILDHCAAVGIDTAMTTNMVPFTERNTEAFVRNCSWIKTSINAGTAESYARVHRTKARDFDRVLDNFRRCVEVRRSWGYTCTIGAQMLLLPENSGEAVGLAAALKGIGVDYLVVKPYSQHHSSITREYEGIDYRPYLKIEEELQALDGDGFNVVFRIRTMRKLYEDKSYAKCLSTPFFWAYVMSDGSLYGCSAYLEDERFNYGNLHHSTFREIWEGRRRMENYGYVRGALNIRDCRVNCRMDEINRYLWKLKHPDRHVNFI